jgi:hypothetical protein
LCFPFPKERKKLCTPPNSISSIASPERFLIFPLQTGEIPASMND